MKFKIPWKNEIYDCEWIEKTDFEKLDEIKSILGFIFDDFGKLCVVGFKDKKNWDLPGGHLEDYDKNFEECLIREVAEEADLELKEITRIGYMSSLKRGNSKEKKEHQLRYVAKVHKIKKQTIDPSEGYIPKRKFIDPEEFIKHTQWEKYSGLDQLKKAIEILKRNQKPLPNIKKKQWHVYILECQDGSFYTGVTNDIDARMNAHAEGKGSKYVYRKGFRKLLFAEPCKDKSHACKCECEIKKLPRNQKLNWFE